MTYTNWCDAVAVISQLTEPAREEQRELARIAGIELPETLPAIVAGARLQNALARTLGLSVDRASTDLQLDVLDELEANRNWADLRLTYREANAWISYFRLLSRQQSLEALQIETGDVVELVNNDNDTLFQVSSISDEGRLYFRGRHSAWPDQVAIRARRVDTGEAARDARRSAANQAAERDNNNLWSLTKQAELRNFEARKVLTTEDVEYLRNVIDNARDEKPIQALVQKRPQLLTSLLGGSARYCIPQVRFGAERVADFLICDVDSLGVRWIFVELETPRSNVTLRRSNQLDSYARKGVSQVVEWREWLRNNLSYARQPKRESGLGLPDIRPDSDGLVLVGRRARLKENSAQVRNPTHEQNNILVHTYDWWLERLEGVVAFHGPWASNPYILHREQTSTHSGDV